MSFYGADRVLAEYCDVNDPPPIDYFSWQHGWCTEDRQSVDPLLLVMEPVIDFSKTFLVARPDEAEYLRLHGLTARAIGLPFLYARPLPAVRIPNSLLVMPAHSLEYTRHNWKFDEYVDQIAAISSSFDQVVACIHPSCVRKNYWLPQLERIGIPWVSGAETYDGNGIQRIKTLLHQFEFVTTNILGSHIVYAAASGARVSIFGDFAEYRHEDFAGCEYYNLNPHLLEPVLRIHSEAYVRDRYRDLFCEPQNAPDKTDWALGQMGASNRLTPREIRRLFGWDSLTRLKTQTKAISRHFARIPERWVKQIVARSRLKMDR